jgi:hypothetical protein
MDSQGLPASGLSAGYGRNIPSHLGRCPTPIPAYVTTRTNPVNLRRRGCVSGCLGYRLRSKFAAKML